MSRTPRRASKQVDYAAYGDGEDEDSLDLSAEDADDDEDVRPKKREKKAVEHVQEKKKEKVNIKHVILDDEDDNVVLVDQDDDFDLGKRIIGSIFRQKIPEITKPKKNVIDDEVINLDDDDDFPPQIVAPTLPKIGGQVVKTPQTTRTELSVRVPEAESKSRQTNY
jgi:hypothetical protein